MLFVSSTIRDVLHESQENWMGTCFYDLLHPKDIQKVKEQLNSFDLEEGKGGKEGGREGEKLKLQINKSSEW